MENSLLTTFDLEKIYVHLQRRAFTDNLVGYFLLISRSPKLGNYLFVQYNSYWHWKGYTKGNIQLSCYCR